MVVDKELDDRIRRFQSQSVLFIHSDDDAIKRKISAPIKERIKQAAGEKCPLCPNIMISSSIKRTPLDDRESTPDHIVDLVLGGNNTEENFLILCHKCNWAKNHAMQRHLTISGIPNGGSPGSKPWRPAFRRKGSYIAKLLEYVEWSFRIEEPSSEHRFPELHGYFMQDRFGKSEEPKSKIEKTPDNISQTPTISELVKRLEKLENTLWKKLIRFIGGLFVRKPKTTRKPKTPPKKDIEKAKESAAKSSTKKINDHRDRIARTNVDTKETAAEEESMKGANAANIGKTIVMLEDKSGMSSGTTANIVGSNGTQWKLSNGKTIQRSQHMEAWALVATAETNATVEGILEFKHIIKEILILEPGQRATVSAIGQRFSKEVQSSNYDNKKDFFKQNGIDPKITIQKAIAEFFDDEEVTIEDIMGAKWAVLNRRD